MTEPPHRVDTKEIETKDYTTELACINEKLEGIITNDTLNAPKNVFHNQAATNSKLVTAVTEQQERAEKIIIEHRN